MNHRARPRRGWERYRDAPNGLLLLLQGELIEHPYLAESYYRGIQHFQSLKGGDLVRFSALMYQLFYIFRELYFQLDGHLEPRLWGPTETVMRDINAYPELQDIDTPLKIPGT
jgi:hypothetical protein